MTDAGVHDSQVFDELLDRGNTSKDVWADSAYRSEDQEESLKEKGYRSRIHRRAYKNKPLTKWEKQGNRTRSKPVAELNIYLEHKVIYVEKRFVALVLVEQKQKQN